MSKVIVTGGRGYDDQSRVFAVLDSVRATFVIQGGATGADALARKYAAERRLHGKTYHADWATNGRAAGPIRNAEMLKDHPDAIVLAFPGGRGTADCVRQAKAKGMQVIEVQP